MKKIFLVRFMFLLTLSGLIIGISGCETETIIIEEAGNNQFYKLVEQYNLTYEILTPSKSSSKTHITEQTVSIDDLKLILSSLQNLKNTTLPINNLDKGEFSLPRLRSSNPEDNGNVNTTCVSGSNEELTARVCLDLKNGNVTNSTVSFRFPSSLYLNYMHDGGYYGQNGNIVNFSAYGRVEVFVAIHDVVVASYSVAMHGYYDLLTNWGELTFY